MKLEKRRRRKPDQMRADRCVIEARTQVHWKEKRRNGRTAAASMKCQRKIKNTLFSPRVSFNFLWWAVDWVCVRACVRMCASVWVLKCIIFCFCWESTFMMRSQCLDCEESMWGAKIVYMQLKCIIIATEKSHAIKLNGRKMRNALRYYSVAQSCQGRHFDAFYRNICIRKYMLRGDALQLF